VVHQLNFEYFRYWICFELILTKLVPVWGRQEDFVYFYWLFGGVQFGIN